MVIPARHENTPNNTRKCSYLSLQPDERTATSVNTTVRLLCVKKSDFLIDIPKRSSAITFTLPVLYLHRFLRCSSITFISLYSFDHWCDTNCVYEVIVGNNNLPWHEREACGGGGSLCSRPQIPFILYHYLTDFYCPCSTVSGALSCSLCEYRTSPASLFAVSPAWR